MLVYKYVSFIDEETIIKDNVYGSQGTRHKNLFII
jgi:hypothetical protein